MSKKKKKAKKAKKGLESFVDGDGDGAGDEDDASKVMMLIEWDACEGVQAATAALEETYALDFEDIVGGMPTRFKYRTVPVNDFGLTPQEVRHDYPSYKDYDNYSNMHSFLL